VLVPVTETVPTTMFKKTSGSFCDKTVMLASLITYALGILIRPKAVSPNVILEICPVKYTRSRLLPANANASRPISVTFGGMMNSLSSGLVPGFILNASSLIVVKEEPSLKMISSIEKKFLNASFPIVTTEFGISTLVRLNEVCEINAKFPISVIPSGILNVLNMRLS